MIRNARIEEFTELLRVFDVAKKYMRDNGNPNQWGADYPPLDELKREINEGLIYVLVNPKGYIYGVFMLMDKPEPTYSYIEDGEWIDSSAYGTIHRVAGDGSEKGIFSKIIEYASGRFNHLRIDTHEQNLTMQHVVQKHGFKYCGIIYLQNGDKRLAYEWIKDT